MSLYETLRHFADSWWLLGMVLFFVGAVAWVLRPGSGTLHRDGAMVPFRHERAADAEERGDG